MVQVRNGRNETVRLILENGTVSGGGRLTGNNNFDVRKGTIDTNLAGGVDLIKTTADTITLDGQNSYTGLTDTDPFSGLSLDSDNVIDAYFNFATLSGDYQGSIFTDRDQAFLAEIADAVINTYILGDGLGPHAYGGQNYYLVDPDNPLNYLALVLDVVPATADFGAGAEDGYIMQ